MEKKTVVLEKGDWSFSDWLCLCELFGAQHAVTTDKITIHIEAIEIGGAG